jgi:hypothetical protein
MNSLVLAAVLASSAPPQAEKAWHDAIGSGLTQPLAIKTLTPLPDGTLRVQGSTYPPERQLRWELQVDGDGGVLALRNAPPGIAPGPLIAHAQQLTAVPFSPDGIPIMPTWRLDGCRVQRDWLGPYDLRQFHSTLPSIGGSLPPIDHVDGGGGHFATFLTDDGSATHQWLGRFGRDCAISGLRELPSSARGAMADIPNAPAAYRLVQPHEPGSAGRDHLVRLDIQGEQWRVALENTGAVSLVHVTDEGGAVLLRLRLAADAEPEWHLDHYDAGGTLRWTRQVPQSPWLQVESHGSTVFVAGPSTGTDRTQRFVSELSPNGMLRWSQPLGEDRLVALPTARTAARPLWRRESPDGRSQVVRAGANGLETLAQFETAVQPQAELANGDIAAIAAGDVGGALLLSPAQPPRRLRLAAPVTPHLVAMAQDELGLVVASSGEAPGLRLTAWSRAGQRAWSIDAPPLAEPESQPFDEFELAVHAGRVCVLRNSDTSEPQVEVVCLHRADGRVLHGWERVAGGNARYARVLTIDAAGIDLLVEQCAEDDNVQWQCRPTITRTRVGEGATSQRLHTDAWIETLLQAPAGGYLLALRDADGTALAAHDSNHALRWSHAAKHNVHPLALHEDGSALVREGERLVAYAPDGSPRWQRTFSEDEPAASAAAVALPGGDYVLLQGRDYAWGPVRRLRLRGADGSLAWEFAGREIATAASPTHTLQLSADGTRVFRHPAEASVAPLWTANRRVLALDVENGAWVGAAGLPEVVRSGKRWHMLAGTGRDGRFAQVYEDVERGEIAVQLDAAAPLLAPARPLDPTLLGAWQSSDTPGQGFFFDQDRSGLSFGAWFTYGETATSLPGALRWYTLGADPGGDTGDGARTFVIYRNDKGQFARGPASQQRAVGRATLRRTGCDEATLWYRFDPEADAVTPGALERAIPLRRAAPASRPCNGGTAAVAARGLDPRASGAWHDPSRPGQGIAFDLRPPTATDAGLFVGAWFTFDPSGAADDPFAQHWFTLAGSLEAAADGTFEVAILRTLGGHLDSDATNNTWRVGTAYFSFAGCDTVRLEYAFETTDLAQAFAGLTGRIDLRRVGGCGD